MPSLNKVILIGNMVADPELKQTQSGVGVCSFRIGVQRRFKDADGTYKSDFIDIVAWRQQAEFVCKYFKKGSSVIVCGSLQVRQWTATDGSKRYSTEVVADEVSFAASKSDGATGAAQTVQAQTAAPAQYATPPAANFEDLAADDDLPF